MIPACIRDRAKLEADKPRLYREPSRLSDEQEDSVLGESQSSQSRPDLQSIAGCYDRPSTEISASYEPDPLPYGVKLVHPRPQTRETPCCGVLLWVKRQEKVPRLPSAMKNDRGNLSLDSPPNPPSHPYVQSSSPHCTSMTGHYLLKTGACIVRLARRSSSDVGDPARLRLHLSVLGPIYRPRLSMTYDVGQT